MTTIENENRTGIYVQESADATTAGDGLAQTRDKSPVASKTENIQDYPHFSGYSKNENENEEKIKGYQSGKSDGLAQRRDKSPVASKTKNVKDHPHFSGHSKNENDNEEKSKGYQSGQSYGLAQRRDKSPVASKTENVKDHPHFSGHSKNENDNEEKNKGYQSGQSDGSDYDVQSDQGDQGDQNDRNDQSNPTNDDKTSRKRKWMPKARNKKIYRYEFDQYYTSPAIKAGANESDSPYSPEGKRWKAQHTLKIMKDLKTNGHALARMKMGLSGRHIERTTDKDDPNSVLHEVRIEDRSNPFKEISKENRVLLVKAIETTVEDENVLAGNNYEIKIGKYEFENKILLLRCKNKRTIRFLKRSIPLYNRLWPKADLFVLVSNEPVDRRRYKLKVNLPNYNIMSNEFFKVIGKQNNLPSEHWTLFKRLDSPGFCAFIGVDKISYRRIEGANGFSYIVSLQDRMQFDNGTEQFKHFCGGSLISASWILTAGHCIHYKKPSEIVAVIGVLNLKSNDVDHRGIDLFKVMDFVPFNLKNDIALIRLKIPVLFEGNISLGTIPRLGMKASRRNPCKVIGYGADKFGGIIQDNLKVGEVYPISRLRCKRILGKIMAPQQGDPTVCGLGDSQDSCQGDSGGPLICPVHGKDYIFGIVSHGITCGQPGVPSIYTVTIPYKQWIDSVIN